ncbi:MAG: hypothetical protein NTU57_03600 [Candidatus Aenigmarchaeota archaeon]|nr:hypothetical protein [Candidatus Aenigmarchaeota archaeon]
MGKFVVEDDCFAPRRNRWIDYAGPDPLAWTREGTSILRSVFEVTTTGTGEPRWMWDWGGDPIQMYYWRIAKHNRTTGRFSQILVGIKMVGFKGKAKNEGTFKMEIEPVVRHTFEGNKLVMFFWWIYWHIFYNTVRQAMIERCKAMSEKFIAVIKEIYSMGSIEVE